MSLPVGEPVHRIKARVYYEDTDAAGIVYHTAYLRYAERGRTELLRVCGFDHRTLREREGGGFVVRSMAIEFLRAARLDDELAIETQVLKVRGASLVMEQKITRADRDLVTMNVRLAFLGDDGRAMRLPESLAGAFLHYLRKGT